MGCRVLGFRAVGFLVSGCRGITGFHLLFRGIFHVRDWSLLRVTSLRCTLKLPQFSAGSPDSLPFFSVLRPEDEEFSTRNSLNPAC